MQALMKTLTTGDLTDIVLRVPAGSAAAVIAGVVAGTVDAIVTDHAPHADWEKSREFELAPFGMIGLETSLALAELTGGAFSPALGGVTALWRIGTPEARVPSDGEIAEALKYTDYSKIELRVEDGAHFARLPRGRSMGCVFKNPEGFSAGALIERAGMKGAREGGAFVSCEHANFIINGGGATAREVRALIERVRGAVLRETGVRLTEEIVYIGDD